MYLRGRLFYQTLIDHFSTFAQRLEVDLFIADLDDHKVVAVIETRGAKAGTAINIPSIALSRGAGHEVLNAVLRTRAFVDVIVSGKSNVDVVARENRLKLFAQSRCRTVVLAR